MAAAAAASALIFISGCAGMLGGISTSIETEEFETDYSTVYAEKIVFKGIENKDYASELNLSVESDVDAAVAEFDGLAQEAAELLPEGVKSSFRITQDVKRTKDGFISFIEEHYIYVGGAHGNTSWFPRNIDTLSAEPHDLALSELFSDDGYRETINRLIDEEVEKDPEKYSELWAEPHITEDTENNYYITDEDLVIFFPPYTLSYYAKGFIEFNIRLTEIEGMLKDEYKRIAAVG